MHSSLVRLQNAFGYFTTVAFSVMAVIALSVILHPQAPTAKLSMSNVSVVKGRAHYYATKKEEYAHIKFNLKTDLTSLFSWNTKQVFVYLVAVFPSHHKSTSTNPVPHSEAIIWDAIIPSHLAPFHVSSYIHPGTTKSPKQSRDRAEARSSSPASKQSKRLRTHDAALDEFTAWPKGAEPGIIRLKDARPKYQITTPAGRIAGLENATLHLRYNVQPWVGALLWDAWPRAVEDEGETERWWAPAWKAIKGGRSEAFDLPALKTGASATKKEDLRTETGGEANRGSPR